MMLVVAVALFPLAVLCSCSGGGGTTTTPVAAWEKFRHDQANTGQGNGAVETNPGQIKWHVPIDAGSTASAISASPAIGLDGTVYIATEGGTLAAVEPTHGTIKWSLTSCSFAGGSGPNACPAGERPLGALISSPAVYNFNAVTNIFIGSANGTLFAFQDDGTTRTCTVCFQPAGSDFGGGATIADSTFLSSPNFTTSVVTNAVSGIVIGAAIDVVRAGSTQTVGKLYAVNSDGSLKWQFPRAGDSDIGSVTSSPSFGLDNAIYFSAANDSLYALAQDGTFRWRFPVGAVSDPIAPFASSPLTSSVIYTGTAGSGGGAGTVVAINPDGSLRWRVSSPDASGFAASLAVGPPAFTTPTPTPIIPTAPPGATATPSPTPTFLVPAQSVFAVTTSGKLLVVDTFTGNPVPLFEPAPTPIAGPVLSSPALSIDSDLVIGAADGYLHAINTTTGAEPAGWPVLLEQGVPIRSSPAIADDGTVYVGTDSGMLYAVGTP